MPLVPSRDQTSSSSRDLYRRQTIFWMCWDPQQLVQPVVQQSLREWAETRGADLRQRKADWRPGGSQFLGLSVWAVWNPSQVDATLLAIHEQRTIHPAAIQVAVVADSCAEHSSRLVQSGAQIVVQPLSDLPKILRAIADKMPWCPSDNNPLTQGLLQHPDLWWEAEPTASWDSAD
jgi:hypothetical protein